MKQDDGTILHWVLAISIALILFWGEPDVSDAIRHKIIEWSGVE